MYCRDKREVTDGQNSIGVLAVPFFALGNIELKAVRAREIPYRAGYWESHFLVGCPNVPASPWSFFVERVDFCVKRGARRGGIKPPLFLTVLAPGREGDRPCRDIKQITVDSKIT